MLDAILGIASSSGLGAIVGLFGSWMTKRENRKMSELQFDHDIRMANIDLQMQAAENEQALALVQANIQMAKAEGEIEQDLAETEAFAESLKVQRTKSGIKFVDAIRFLMRPLLTTYLAAVVSYLLYNIHQIVGGLEALSPSELFQLYKYMIMQVVFLFVTATTWWFGSRGDKAAKSLKPMG